MLNKSPDTARLGATPVTARGTVRDDPPPSVVADLMIYLSWSMDGRGAQEGRTALSPPGGGTRVGEKPATCR